jgi:hypothetical protein
MPDHVDLFFSNKDSSEETHPLIVLFKSPSKSKGGKRPIECTKKEVDKTSKAKGNEINQTIEANVHENIVNITNSLKALME